MSVSVCPGKRSYNVVWKVGKIEQCVSNAFSFEGSKWCFVLEKEVNTYHNEEDWKMYLRKIHPREGSHVFLISIYLEDKHRKLECLNFTRLSVSKPGTEQIMWRRRSNVLLKYPNLSLDKDVTFVITLISDHRYMTEIQDLTDTKHVQTPAHMEVQPCLESLSTDLSDLLPSSSSNDSEPDIRLQCGGRTLQAHKALLVARSQVFAAMLQSDMMERNNSSVDIVDTDSSTLEHFLRYLYSGKLPDFVHIDAAAGLYELADKYAVHSLKRRCADFLRDHLTAENACSLLVLANTHCDESFKDSIISFMVHNNDILVSMKEGSSFCALHPKLAVDVLYRAYKVRKLPSKCRK